MNKVFWTIEDLARETGQSESTVKSWMYKGYISYIKMTKSNARSSKGAVIFDREVVSDEIRSFSRSRKGVNSKEKLIAQAA